jgi:hypothetical protein
MDALVSDPCDLDDEPQSNEADIGISGLLPTPEENPAPPTLLLYTADQAAALLQVRSSWLKRKATARAIPCRFLGKHLRFSPDDLTAIADLAAQPNASSRSNRAL